MTGPEHYLEAERLLDILKTGDLTSKLDQLTPAQAQGVLDLVASEAQVHATLALAAATAITSYQAAEDWETAAGQGKP